MKKMLVLILITLFSLYFGFKNYQDKARAESEIKTLKDMIQFKEKQIELNQIASEEIENKKIMLEKTSTNLAEKINDALKNNKCADQRIDTFISKQLYQHANKIRGTASDSTKSGQ